MISELITNYQVLSTKLCHAVEAEDFDGISELDKQIVVLWEQILEYQPTQSDDLEILIRFLIDQFLLKLPKSEINKRASDKLLKLVLSLL